MSTEEQINSAIKNLNTVVDFKEYYKLQRTLIQNYLGSWQYTEYFLTKNPVQQYELLINSFSERLDLDKNKSVAEKEQQGIDTQKIATMEKFTAQIKKSLADKNWQKTSEQLFYVLLGNVIEHAELQAVDLTKFDLNRDLFPKLKMPLSLGFYLFQNLIFGPISTQINNLSSVYLEKYTALFLTLWRSVFDYMSYEKHLANQEKEKQATDHEHNHNGTTVHNHEHDKK